MAVDEDRVVLFEGAEGDPEEVNDGYMPTVWLEQDGNEMYVGVGEEVESMAEGIDAETFAAIRARQLSEDERRVLLAAVMGDHMDPEALQSATAKLTASLGE